MDLTQVKLTKTEWDSIEIPIIEKEKYILNMIITGYTNINIRSNANQSIVQYLRMADSPNIDEYIYKEYFEKTIFDIDPSLVSVVSTKKMKKSDIMRLNLNKKSDISKSPIYENKLITLIRTISSSAKKNIPFHVSYFTLFKMNQNNVSRVNKYIKECVDTILATYENLIDIKTLIHDAQNVLEKNKTLIENEDITLYSHQKDIFRALRNPDYEKRNKQLKESSDYLEGYILDSEDEENDDEYKYHANQLLELKTPANSKLILYSAPTGTGKTLTPIALTNNYRIIFVCAARHVGLALAKNAISMDKKVAFAFGCETADDIRLHYSAASNYTTNKRTGRIAKVDNSVGDKVEIIICDIKSYLCAMNYMIAFNPISNILMYWDEPTISMDYNEHPLHDIIHKMWKNNLVPNIVLSSATLPSEAEIGITINDFITKFPEPNVISIRSHDAKKSIPIINKNGYNVMPHYIDDNENYDTILNVANHCKANMTLLRYMDLQECIDFIRIIEENNYTVSRYKHDRQFVDFNDITITKIKEHYLQLLSNVKDGTWGAALINVKMMRKQRLISNQKIDSTGATLRKVRSIGPGVGATTNIVIPKHTSSQGGQLLTRKDSVQILPPSPSSPTLKSLSKMHTLDEPKEDPPGVFITTKDAETLTGGPTIFIAEDVEKIAKFYLKQSYIPASVLSNIMERVQHNNKLSVRIAELEQNIEDIVNATSNDDFGKGSEPKGKGAGKKKKQQKTTSADKDDMAAAAGNNKSKRLMDELTAIQRMIKPAELSEVFIPNKTAHLGRWASNPDSGEAFTSNISEDIVCQIMGIDGVNDTWKILLLMGIGVFTTHTSQSYTEIMKRMAAEQKLYLIIASSDYIYGTNYQFCHGYLGKDVSLTQQKMLQALGRIGRHNDQQTYSVRLRDNNQGNILFKPSSNDIEVQNINRLFSSRSDTN